MASTRPTRVTLVVAWGTDLQEVLEVRRVSNLRHARLVAEELQRDYPWSPRISFYAEMDFLATEAGMTPDERAEALKRIDMRINRQ